MCDDLTLQGHNLETSRPILMFKKPRVSVFEAQQLGEKIYGFSEKKSGVVAAESTTRLIENSDSILHASIPSS